MWVGRLGGGRTVLEDKFFEKGEAIMGIQFVLHGVGVEK
jgi:hypothetical protein